jgi:hypothetical protein
MAGRITLNDIYQAEGVITIPLTLLDGGEPLDLTGWTMSARLGFEGNKALVTKTVGAGITVTDETAGELTVTFDEDDLDRVARVYDFELRRTGTGTERVLVTGKLPLLSSLFGAY